MPRFRFHAVDANQQPTAGDVEADSAREAIELLEARGLLVQSIGFAERQAALETPVPVVAPANDSVAATVTPERPDLSPLAPHVRQLLSRRALIAPALRAYGDETPNRRRARDLRSVWQTLEQGKPEQVAASLSELPEYWTPLLGAAATSEDAAATLQRFFAHLRTAGELRRQQWAVWAYPAIIVCLTLAVLVLLSVAVIPAFAEIFADFGLLLPWLTLTVLQVSYAINRWGIFIAIAVLSALAMVMIWRRVAHRDRGSRGARTRFSSRSTAIAALARTTAELVVMGLEVAESLRIAASLARRRSLRRSALEFADYLVGDAEAIRTGARRSLSLTLAYALEAPMPVAARVGLLEQLSQVHADRANRQWSWTKGMLGPIAVMALGACVAVVVLALFLPLVSLVNNLSG